MPRPHDYDDAALFPKLGAIPLTTGDAAELCGKDTADGACARPAEHTGPCAPFAYVAPRGPQRFTPEPEPAGPPVNVRPRTGRMPVASPDTEALRLRVAELRRRGVFTMPAELMDPITEGVGRAFDEAEARGDFDCCATGSGKSHTLEHYGAQLAEMMRRDVERGDDGGRELMVAAAHRAGVMFPDEVAVPVKLLERATELLEAHAEGLHADFGMDYVRRAFGDLLQGHRLAHQHPADGDGGVQSARDGTEHPDEQSRPHR